MRKETAYCLRQRRTTPCCLTTGPADLLRQFRRSAQHAQRQHQFKIETLKARQMLNGAPVGVNDPYALPNTGTLVVGDLVGPLAQQDLSLPDPADFTRDEIIRVTDGTHREHPGFLTLGGNPGHYGEIAVANAGSSLTLNQYLLAGSGLRPCFGHRRRTIAYDELDRTGRRS